MNKKLSRYTLSALLLILVGAAPIAASEDLVIAGITFTGLKRTREAVVQRIIRPVETGAVFSADTEALIIQKLRETGIFNPDINVKTRVVEHEVFIDIFVRDRWTLIPVPIVSLANDGAWRAGLLSIDSNFLGFYKTLGLGFFFGSEGWTLISFFGDQSFFGTELGFTAGISAGLDEPEIQNVDEVIIREYQTYKFSIGFGLDYPVTEQLSAGVFCDYDQSQLRSGSSLATGIPNLYSSGIGTMLKWDNLFYDIPYTRGLSVKNRFAWNWGFNGSENYPVIDGSLTYSFRPVFNHLVNFTVLGGWGRLPVQKQFPLGGLPGSVILPMSKIAADEFLTSSLSYNVPVWSFKGGTVAMKAFYETGYYKSDLVERTMFHGPGLGLELYINNLALPAIGVNAGWNLETGRFQISGGIGMGGGPN